MFRFTFFLLILFTGEKAFAQKQLPLVHDTSDHAIQYLDFSYIDDIAYWNYDVKLENWWMIKDSIGKPIGRIFFFRVKKILTYGGRMSTPLMSYRIYAIKDSLEAMRASIYTRSISSCFPLRGGELLTLKNFILVNEGVCTGAQDMESREFCRPTVDFLLGRNEVRNAKTINELIDMLPLKRSAYMERGKKKGRDWIY